MLTQSDDDQLALREIKQIHSFFAFWLTNEQFYLSCHRVQLVVPGDERRAPDGLFPLKVIFLQDHAGWRRWHHHVAADD